MSSMLVLGDTQNYHDLMESDRLVEILFTLPSEGQLVLFAVENVPLLISAVDWVIAQRKCGKGSDFEEQEVLEECLRDARYAWGQHGSTLPLASNALLTLYNVLQLVPAQSVMSDGLYLVQLNTNPRSQRYWSLQQLVKPPQTLCYELRRTMYTTRRSISQLVRSAYYALDGRADEIRETMRSYGLISTGSLDSHI